ncbi:MAG TPA: hypothetical protein VKB76_01315, partial [Ktedonobacterales bacterium]|nr:hypothetical protein [Ktedonobacterales bacterium]
ARMGWWLALAGITLFTLSLTQTWADFPSSYPAPGPVHATDVLFSRFSLFDYGILGIVPLVGFFLWTLMWHPQFSRGAVRLFPLWSLAATLLFGYITFLFISMPVNFPDVGFWLAVAALFLIWNAVLVLFRSRSPLAEATSVSTKASPRRQLIAASTLYLGMIV